ncbi:hypothetical protein FO439_04785 [Weissella cibaria]|uniref:Uncharacterized protein n=1 Tax=Weissella cibaria TaxID=137591 RepID=A0A9Q8JI85_9LACO|nr:hypothetical protein [Weissella cibaria]QDG80224.1 hypothetical protein Wei3612_02035 [Weissella cibaria]TVV27634.1 hypothetical protein FO435_06950 [Weissella cibaria]TVV35943.1 hypothetical protein FO439_04785 [Weissella cibaria]TVV40825.1 hypothetical protein FO438_06780 [Weissella cibaria]UNW39838.1 hypothetical protein HUW87_06040 [Weissella cibaria]
MQLKRLGLILAAVTAVILFTTGNVQAADKATERIKQLDTTLEQAQEVTLVQKFFRLSTSYDVRVAGKSVGTLTGDFWHPFGDTLALETPAGDVAYREHQSRRLLALSIARGGVFATADGTYDGALREKVWALFFHQYQFLDKSGDVVGQSRRNPFHLFATSYRITDNNGKRLYTATTER